METKFCYKCKCTKSISLFSKSKHHKDGMKKECKQCASAAERLRHASKKEEIKKKVSEHYFNNKELYRKRNLEYLARNPHKVAFYSSNRRAAERRAKPSWLTDDDISIIDSLYSLCKIYSSVFGECHVDHIVPLRGKNVCGLHVPSNLQILPKQENLKKSNKHG